MAKGIVLCVGVKEFSNNFYDVALRDTISCKRDAARFGEVAQKAGFEVEVLNDPQTVTWPKFKSVATDIAARLDPGGFFVLMFSGHGIAANIRGKTIRRWCFFDQWIYRHGSFSVDSVLKLFKPDAHIALVVNCCFSGDPPDGGVEPSTEPVEVAAKVIESQRGRLTLRGLFKPVDAIFGPKVQAEVIEMDACGGTQVARDGTNEDEPSPFIRDFTELVDMQIDTNVFRDFDGFVQLIRARSPADHKPERSALRVSAAFEALGPLRLP